MKWYLKVLHQYLDFSGRARRKEYWVFVLFNMIFVFVAIIIDALLGIDGDTVGPLYIGYTIATLIPGIAVFVRRIHDIGKSGWMLLVGLIPIVGAIWLMVLIFTDSQHGDNRWGKNPKEISI